MLTIEISSSNRVFGLLAKRQKGYDNLIFDQNIHLPIEHEKFLIKRIKKPFISGHLATNTGVWRSNSENLERDLNKQSAGGKNEVMQTTWI